MCQLFPTFCLFAVWCPCPAPPRTPQGHKGSRPYNNGPHLGCFSWLTTFYYSFQFACVWEVDSFKEHECIFHQSSWSQSCPQRSVKVCYSFLPARLLDCKSPCSPLRADTSKTCRRLLLTSRCEVKWHRCQGIGSETETGGAGAVCHKHDKVFLSVEVDPIETGEFIMANYCWSDLVWFSFSILGRVQLIKVARRKGCRWLMSF